MSEFGPINFLRTIITIILVYQGIKFLFRWWLKRKVNAMMKIQEQTISEQEAAFKKQEQGKVHVHQANKRSATSSSNDGDYVDYEEVE